MLDYRHLEALTAVWEEEGFEKAADILFITQSAVSQRVKALEEQIGQILISRSFPPVPTDRGRELIRHFCQVRLMESSVAETGENRRLAVGINADSLATWFMEGVMPFLEGGGLLDLRVDDQEKTREMLRKGEVAGCIGSDDRPLQGCGRQYLGAMAYVLVCRESFRERWFPDGLTDDAISEAPAVIYNRNDRLHHRFLGKILPSFKGNFPIHYVPSSEQFLGMVERGWAYGAVPLLQAAPRLGRSLRELCSERVEVKLWWHHWNLNIPPMAELTALLRERSGSLIY